MAKLCLPPLTRISWSLVFISGLMSKSRRCLVTCSFAPLPSFSPDLRAQRKSTSLFSQNGNDDPSMEALRSLVDYHEGSWNGRATSFTVTEDCAAGIVNRQAKDYSTTVRLQLSDEDYELRETFEWGDEREAFDKRSSLVKCYADVDSVDASYSLDSSSDWSIPEAISGTSANVAFAIEHCLATSDDERVRCFVLYNEQKALERIVICEELRADGQAASIQEELNLLKSDVDRIVNKIAGQIKTEQPSPKNGSTETILDQLQQRSAQEEQDNTPLSRCNMGLMQMTSGVWLGDSVIRDVSQVSASPYSGAQGFGESSSQPMKQPTKSSFADWDVGVQKVAWRWEWDYYQDAIRQSYDYGRVMGVATSTSLPTALTGNICLNESFSRRIPKDERTVFVDFDNGDFVAFLLRSCSIQVPRYLSFPAKAATRQFFTEFSVFQSAVSETLHSKADDGSQEEIVCSKILRFYNYEGRLKQGCTSFFELKDMSQSKS